MNDDGARTDKVAAQVERLVTAQPAAAPEAERVRRPFPVVARREEGERHLALQVEVDRQFDQAFERPGQYVTLAGEGSPPRFYAIASRIEAGRWEFLVDRKGEIGSALVDLEVGDELSVSLPEGRGFEIAQPLGATALLFCTGSGLATVRPLVEAWLDGPKRPAEIALYYGERRVADFAYNSLLASWQSEVGVQVHLAAEETAQAHRYVQQAFADAHPPLDDVYVYLSGAAVMVKLVAEEVLNRKIPVGRIKLNI